MLCFTNCLDFFACFFFFFTLMLWYLFSACRNILREVLILLYFSTQVFTNWSVHCAFNHQFKLRVSFNPLTLRGDHHGTSPYNTHTLSCKQVLRKFQLIREKLFKLSGSLKHHLVYSVLQPRHWNKCCKTVHHSSA